MFPQIILKAVIALNTDRRRDSMKTVTVKGRPPVDVVSPEVKTVVSTTDPPVNLITGAVPPNVGRLAIDNELARIKYCV